MQGFIEFPNNNSHIISCGVATGEFLPVIQKEEAEYVSSSCYNPFRSNIVTCKNKFREEFIQEVNGLDFNVSLSSTIRSLPPYIPIVDLEMSKVLVIPNDIAIIGITLGDIISRGVIYKAGRLHEQNDIALRRKILSSECFKDRKVILFLTGADTLIEWIWFNRTECHFFETLSKMGFWAVCGFNFSVIDGECAFSQALNQKRSLFSSLLIERVGLLTIPHVYALTNFHIERWIKWFEKNPLIHTFTINCQLQKSKHDINQVIKVVIDVLRQIPYLHVILQGFPFSQLWQFEKFINRIHFADKVPIKFAQNSKVSEFDFENKELKTLFSNENDKKAIAIKSILSRQRYISYIANNTFYDL